MVATGSGDWTGQDTPTNKHGEKTQRWQQEQITSTVILKCFVAGKPHLEIFLSVETQKHDVFTASGKIEDSSVCTILSFAIILSVAFLHAVSKHIHWSFVVLLEMYFRYLFSVFFFF